jgi:hypothetical protein
MLKDWFKNNFVLPGTSKSQPEPDFGEPSARAQAEGSVEPSKGDFCSAGPENSLEITLRQAQDDFSPITKMQSRF